MSDLIRRLGRALGRMANSQDLISGIMSGIDPRVVARAVNENSALLGEVMKHLEPEALAGMINSNPDFLSRLLKGLDASALAAAMNRNQRFLVQLIENTHPNLFTRAANALFNRIRKASYRPGLTNVKELQESA